MTHSKRTQMWKTEHPLKYSASRSRAHKKGWKGVWGLRGIPVINKIPGIGPSHHRKVRGGSSGGFLGGLFGGEVSGAEISTADISGGRRSRASRRSRKHGLPPRDSKGRFLSER